ncbi:hypothetical protein LQW54_010100 [Pestalotiopsis sp. IQ-011]
MAPSAISNTYAATGGHGEGMDIFTKKGADTVNLAVGAANGKSTIPTLTDFATKDEEQKYHKEHLVAASRVFAANGFDEGLSGHMSLYTMHFADITVSDLVRVTEDAEVVHGTHAVNAAGFAIHSEIHKAHPWVNAVCHAHSTAGKAYSAFGRPPPPLTQDSLKFYGHHTSCTSLLSVGATIDEACYWFCSFDKCCQAQLLIDAASAFHGEPRRIDEEVAVKSAKILGARNRGWLHFQAYYSNMLKKTNGSFLQ